MKISDTEFRGYAAMALVGVIMSKGTGDPKGCAKAAISVAEAMRKELAAIKGEDEPYGKSADRSDSASA